MCDVDLMASMLRSCTPSTHILFVGDTGQLAPVGHGRPFFDLQQCVPTGKLTDIRRNSGRIVKACAEIRDHRKITFSPKMSIENGENLVLIQCDDESQPQVLEQLIAKIETLPEFYGLSIVDDLQILTGKNDGSPVSRKPLNAMLQKILNPSGEQIQGNPFRIGDKIVCLKNAKYQDAEDPQGEQFVANGELAKVLDIKPGRMVVRMHEPARTILILHAPVQENESGIDDSENTARGAVGDWDMGYVLSVHRSQGSQWKFAIVMADSKGAMVQTRNWIYTAVSRAEIATFVIGQNQVVNAMMKRDGIMNRKTFLVERITSQRAAVSVDFEDLFAEV
jgi:exodeoxyribonuclease V alpha subunit